MWCDPGENMKPDDKKKYTQEMVDELAENGYWDDQEEAEEYWKEDEMESADKYDVEDLWMNEFEISYSLNKQLSCMEHIHTNYGDIPLDVEMIDIIEKELRKLLEKRLAELKQKS
jgi:hypothetical protein